MEDRLIAAYERGLLVPFLGAGMSDPVCSLWGPFVERLEERAGIEPPAHSPNLVERAAQATRRIRHDARGDVAEAVRAALSAEPKQPPEQARQLARTYWPLVLTTNYDDVYVAAVHEAHEEVARRSKKGPPVVPVRLLGRSASDCQRVLMALRRPEVPILWVLQGYVGGQAASSLGAEGGGLEPYEQRVLGDSSYRLKTEALRKELVIGHAEYRHVVSNAVAFRRAFAEVYRSRSFLFLGSGLTDKYFLDLFSEVIELHGPSPLPHFAYMLKDTVNRGFLRDYFGIWVLELDCFNEFPARLAELADGIAATRLRQTQWVLAESPRRSLEPSTAAELIVVRGPLVPKPEEGGCLVVSAGGTRGRLMLSGVVRTLDNGADIDAKDFKRIDDEGEDSLPIWQHQSGKHLLAVNARMNPWSKQGALLRPLDPSVKPIGSKKQPTENSRTLRDLRLVEPATRQVLRLAAQCGYNHVHSMLLAAGGRRTFPRASALLQMARGWARLKHELARAPSLSVYVRDENREVLLDLQSGRLDLHVGIDPEILEFWVELEGVGTSENRYLCSELAGKRLLDMVAELDVRSDSWSLGLEPAPTWGWQNWTIAAVRTWEATFHREMTLERFGLLPASILVLSRSHD